MKYNSISGLFTAIADEIRAKEGSSELINPQDLPERVKNLSVMPDVPTLECYKLVRTEDNQDLFEEFVMNNFVCDIDHSVLATCKWDIEDEEFIISGGSTLSFSGEWMGVQEIYILWYPDCMTADRRNSWRESAVNAGAERITLSEWLEITAKAINYRERYD